MTLNTTNLGASSPLPEGGKSLRIPIERTFQGRSVPFGPPLMANVRSFVSQTSAPKNHHYVPASYLSRFSNSSGYLHIYDRARNQTRRQRPGNVMKIGAYYRQAWAPTGVDVNIFETSLGTGLEANAKVVIDRLTLTHETLSEDEAADFLVYVELQRIRVPRQATRAVSLMRSAILEKLPDSLLERMRTAGLELTMKDSARFDYMRMAIGTINPWLSRMEWEVVTAEPGSFFLTSDSPVSFFNPEAPPPAEAGLGCAGTIVLFPLSSKHLLVMRHPECGTLDPLIQLPMPEERDYAIPLQRGRVLPAEVVERTNWRLAALAQDLIAGGSPEIVEAAAKALSIDGLS